MSKIAAIILSLGLVLAAAVPAKAEEILVTEYTHDPTGAPFAIALANGYFKKAGVDVTGVISGHGGGSSLRAAMATALGYGEVAPGAAIAAINQGQDIKIVGIGSRLLDLNLIVMPNSGIKTLQDLKGKKFAISNPKSLTELTAVLVAEKAGFKPDEIQRVALGSLGGALTAVEKGVCDTTALPAALFRLEHGSTKFRSLLTPKDMPHLPPGVEVATGELMKNHPDKLRAILAARAEAVRYIYAHTDDAAKILEKLYAPLPPDQVHAMVHELAAARFWSEGNIEMPLLQTAERAMLAVGMLQGNVNLTTMIDPAYLPSDLQKVTQ